MYCPSCGARCSPDSIACHACGAILPGLTESLGRGPAAVAGPPAPVPPTSEFSAVGVAVPTQAPGRPLDETPADPENIIRNVPPDPWQQQRVSEPLAAAPAAAWFPSSAAPQPEAVVLTNPLDSRLLGRAKLMVEQGKILGEQFLLADFDITVGRYDAGTGRCPDIDLTAQDPAYVYWQHVRLTFGVDGKSLTLHDMGGRNGCYVNNQLLDKNGSAPVRIGDKVRIGRVVMRLQPVTDAERDPRK